VALIAFDARKASEMMPHGSGIYVRRLLEALRRRPPADHQLWAIERGGPMPEVLWEQLVLPARLRARRAALVHGPDSFLPLRRGCAGVLTVHDLAFAAIPEDMPGPTGWKYRAFVPRAARSAERVICPSRFTAQDVQERCGVPAERIRVIPEAPALPAGTHSPPPAPYLLSVGDLRPKKNLPLVIAAYRRLRGEGLEHRLVLAGADVGMGARLVELAAGEPVELAGYVDDARLDALMRGADALIVASLYEGFGLAVLDAMARGCPVILARAGALPETGGDAALYFEPQDTEQLADTVRLVVTDASVRARLAEAGRRRAAGFSWERTAAATVAVYEELLG
jgi:glycosyltransferase involved in cell wall biosynthesis